MQLIAGINCRSIMVSDPPPSHPPIIMGGLNLKIFQNFVGTKIFLGFAGEKTSMGGVKIVSGE